MKKSIPVVGMACSACAANVERKLNSLKGIKQASVNLAGRYALVDFDANAISLEQMKKAISDLGYDLVIDEKESVEAIERNEFRKLRWQTMLSWMFAILTMAVSMDWIPLQSATISNQTTFIIALANIIFCGKQFYKNSWKQIRHGVASMDTLVALSTSISFSFSTIATFVPQKGGAQWPTYFDASVMIITFVLTGRLLEEKAKDTMTSSIRRMMGICPKNVRLVCGKKTETVPLSTIQCGDILEVRAGERIPVDGEIIMSTSFMTNDAAYIDESMITGEPTPAQKKKGDKVLAGTIPNQGKIRMQARQVGEDTALAHIIHTVREAQGSKAPVQRITDRIALFFVPAIVGISLITFLCWWILGTNNNISVAVQNAVAVLVIACPCALGLATPTALMVGIGKAANRQILIKDASALELLHRVTALVMDKTGTLTISNEQIDFTKSDQLPLEEREHLKPNATEAISLLHKMGVDTFLISGDKTDAVKHWANKVGIKNYYAEVRPQDKEELVKKLQAKGYKVAMVGDGINDTAALARADVSIAIGKGTDVAMDVASTTLMSDDLIRIPEAFSLSKLTIRMIKQNLFWAFSYNAICIPLAAGLPLALGYDFEITPSWAAGLMALSSISVVLNSLRLSFIKGYS